MKILSSKARVSRSLRSYVEDLVDRVRSDDPSKSRDEAQAWELRKNLLNNLRFLRHIRKARGCPDSVVMELHVDIDTQYELEEFAHSVGLKNWRSPILIHYAKRMEEENCEEE